MKASSLVDQGKKNLELAEKQMGALQSLRKRFIKEKPFKGLRIGMALHITKETGVLVRTLRDGGAQIALCSCNPLSTQDDVAAALNEEKDVKAYGYKGESSKDYYAFLNKVAASKPHLVIDDGCDLVTLIKEKYAAWSPHVLGGSEETTTGVLRLKSMENDDVLPFPMVAVNDNKTKHLMDNLYGTGQSTLDGILRATNILFSGKTVVVAGYGSCGKGVASRARGLGARVIVTEIDPFKALQAHMDGHQVLPMKEASPLGDIFITVTGDVDVITVEHMRRMKDGAILANSGHFDCEIDVKGLRRVAKKSRLMRPFMEEFSLPNGKVVYILADGRLVNLSAAEGHPSEVMSLSFCGQALACEFLVKQKGKLDRKVYTLPPEVDETVATLHLKAQGISIDKLSPKQVKYLKSWQSGT